MPNDNDGRIIVARTRPAQRRRRGPGNFGRKRPDGAGDARLRLPRPPAPAALGGPSATPPLATPPLATQMVGWRHLLVNGTDDSFRRMLRGLAATVRRIDVIHDLAAHRLGLTGTDLELLLVIAEGDEGRDRRGGGSSEGDGIDMPALARRLDASPYYTSARTGRLLRKGLVEKHRQPGRGIAKRVVLTQAGREAVASAAPLLLGAHNLAFAPLTARDFAALCRIAAKLDAASSRATEILAKRVGEAPPQALHELRSAMKSLMGK